MRDLLLLPLHSSCFSCMKAKCTQPRQKDSRRGDVSMMSIYMWVT